MCKNCGLVRNACLNITRRVGYSPPTPTRIEAYTPTHQGVVVATERRKIQPLGAKQ
ncbi:MAG: hypothetical protein ACP5PL_00645 [Infirmifilum sp.]